MHLGLKKGLCSRNKKRDHVQFCLKMRYGCYAERPEYFIWGINGPRKCVPGYMLGSFIKIYNIPVQICKETEYETSVLFI